MPMDYVEIRASKNGHYVNGELPIIIRGFVDSSTPSFSFSSSGGPSEPRVTISGRDYTKLLIEWQVLYLWTQNTFKQGGNLGALIGKSRGLGLYFNFRLPLAPETITQFFEAVMKNMVDPIFTGLKKYPFGALPDLQYNFVFPEYPMSSLNVLSYTGSYWNLMQYIASPPFGELFIWDDVDAPVITSRMAPYTWLDGAKAYPADQLDLPYESLGNIENIVNFNPTRTDHDLYTYFLTYGSTTQLVGLTMPAFVTGKGNGITTSYADLYGIRPLMIDTSWISEFNASDIGKPNPSAVQLGDTLNQWLVATMGETQYFWSGSIQCHGDEDFHIGTYRTVPSRNQIYYVSGIQDMYTVGSLGSTADQWTANLQVVRGRDF